MHVIVLTTVLPGGRRGGGEIVTQGVVDALRKAGNDVLTVGYSRRGLSAPVDGELSAGERAIESSSAGSRRLPWAVRALAWRLPYSGAKYRSRAYIRVAREALSNGPAAVVVDHAQTYFALSGLWPLAHPVIFLAHNVEAELYGQLAAEAERPAARWAYRREARLIARAEKRLVRAARQVWALTPDDAAALASLGGADVRTLDVASHLQARRVASPACDVALLGSWSWRANARGLEWFMTDVVPRLPEDVRVEVAGAGADWLRDADQRVVVRGRVEDAEGFLASARVIAVPAVAGAGVQIKTLDAIASGIPVVATGLAVRGLDQLPPSVGVAEGAEEFARQLMVLARQTDRERFREAALAWSSARGAKLEADVAGFAGEVTESA